MEHKETFNNWVQMMEEVSESVNSNCEDLSEGEKIGSDLVLFLGKIGAMVIDDFERFGSVFTEDETTYIFNGIQSYVTKMAEMNEDSTESE